MRYTKYNPELKIWEVNTPIPIESLTIRKEMGDTYDGATGEVTYQGPDRFYLSGPLIDRMAELENAQASAVAPVRHGRWLPYFEDVEVYNSGGFTERKQTGWICGKCKRKSSFVKMHRPYCSECGAIMDKEEGHD